MSKENLPLVKATDLSQVDNPALSGNQIGHLLKTTPQKYVRSRPAKGGGQWKYVTGGYVKKTLNFMFGWDWDFEIIEQMILHGEAIVKGKLTCRTNGKTIIKTQFGNKDIIYKKDLVNGERVPLSIGNDLKAAATDALKKCAAEIGIAADIYNAEEFQSINVIEDDITFNENHPNWNKAVEAIKNKSFTIEQIATKYVLTDEIKTKLESYV